ncbi:polysaccharide biosynthesis protein [Paenibacillus sp. J31TS4]|uniref:polysaccharide biosynthesis protein n=1 Tax=Paenibacillus sp. J31TS4 TaxID=2807195 RepID=UPI001B1E177E|nr:nucleoside-diphosphate sugar epimerase/dehydratase [Paenibacillus sp. J31TS4]GIP39968.1 polysaccharide biosynthesis protein [Paenibacillus sp. J31TS4]
MTVRTKVLLLVGVDIVLVWLSILTSYLLKFNGTVPAYYQSQLLLFGIVGSLGCTAAMIGWKLYRRVWQYASVGELLALFKAVTFAMLAAYCLTLLLTQKAVPLSVFLRSYETSLLLMGGLRFLWRIYRHSGMKREQAGRPSLVIGAGDCGTLIVKEMKQNVASTYYPVAFIDDDRNKQRQQIYGVPVLGGREAIHQAVVEHGIEDIIIAMPSVSKKVVSELIAICRQTSAKVKIIPDLDDLIQGKLSMKAIRDVRVEDLLGREPVQVDLEGIMDYVHRKRVLVTGAGGSIGSELCRQLGRFRPDCLVLVGHGENSIFSIEGELKRLYPELRLHSVIADIQDRKRMEEVFSLHRPQVVFHAAAHKHVPLMESNPSEAIKNNVFGTRNVAECADRWGAERFVLISSDKAVNPTSIMGATKRIAEQVIQSLDRVSETKYVAVRFGNVLGSRGSVIPFFKQQIEQGGPVTVTHPEMIRYFMTIPEAVQLVLQAGSFAKGGEIFILDMGEPVKILTLAEELIRLSGLKPGEDIEIAFSGIRPGEKLYEELLTQEEGLTSTRHNRIFVGKPSGIPKAEVDFAIKTLEKALTADAGLLREAVKHIVPTYQNVS